MLQLQDFETKNFAFAQETAILATEPPSPGLLGAKMSSNLSDTSLTPEQVAARYLLGDSTFFDEEKDKPVVNLMEQNKMILPDRLIHKAEG